VDAAAQDYIDAIAPQHRPLFDRLHGLIMQSHPDAELTLSYDMPTYRLEGRKLHVAVWKHGLSIYGWRQGGDDDFVSRHPELKHNKSTIRLSPDAAAEIADGELLELVDAALAT